MVINWLATATWPENKADVDVLAIDPAVATPDPLVLVLLNSAKETELARQFMKIAASDRGQEVFRRHGLAKSL
jgi:molybdate transport system substrate-binding protein